MQTEAVRRGVIPQLTDADVGGTGCLAEAWVLQEPFPP